MILVDVINLMQYEDEIRLIDADVAYLDDWDFNGNFTDFDEIFSDLEIDNIRLECGNHALDNPFILFVVIGLNEMKEGNQNERI